VTNTINLKETSVLCKGALDPLLNYTGHLIFLFS